MQRQKEALRRAGRKKAGGAQIATAQLLQFARRGFSRALGREGVMVY